MGMIYTVTFAGQAATAQVDFFEYTAPADAIVVVHSVEIAQSTDVGDAAAEGLQVLHKRGATSSGTGGATPTPAPTEFGFAAAGGVADTMNTTKASGGTIVTLHSDAWNIAQKYLWIPVPEARHYLSPSQRYTVERGTTPADSITFNGTMVVEEIGG